MRGDPILVTRDNLIQDESREKEDLWFTKYKIEGSPEAIL